jgi:hypothetical protein
MQIENWGANLGPILGAKARPGVHARHCCRLHGCKYGYDDCPVVDDTVQQEYPCEDCHDDINEWSPGYTIGPIPVGSV